MARVTRLLVALLMVTLCARLSAAGLFAPPRPITAMEAERYIVAAKPVVDDGAWNGVAAFAARRAKEREVLLAVSPAPIGPGKHMARFFLRHGGKGMGSVKLTVLALSPTRRGGLAWRPVGEATIPAADLPADGMYEGYDLRFRIPLDRPRSAVKFSVKAKDCALYADRVCLSSPKRIIRKYGKPATRLPVPVVEPPRPTKTRKFERKAAGPRPMKPLPAKFQRALRRPKPEAKPKPEAAPAPTPQKPRKSPLSAIADAASKRTPEQDQALQAGLQERRAPKPAAGFEVGDVLVEPDRDTEQDRRLGKARRKMAEIEHMMTVAREEEEEAKRAAEQKRLLEDVKKKSEPKQKAGAARKKKPKRDRKKKARGRKSLKK